MLSRQYASKALSVAQGNVLLLRASVPRACLTDASLRAAADAEGVVSCDVYLCDGAILGVGLAGGEELKLLGDEKDAMELDAKVGPDTATASCMSAHIVPAHTHRFLLPGLTWRTTAPRFQLN
jgi:hypothetical protein